jgi:23S rRNA (pseudouridine1915-N3)-methyltransferase
MLGIKIICVGKLKEQFYTDAANEYVKRLGGYCKPEIVELPEQRLPDKPSDTQITLALEKESAAIERVVPTNSKTIALCVEGGEFDSPGLSRLILDSAEQGISRLCFIVGGSYGLSDEVKKKADVKLSMSKMTFPHHLARIILLEQLYRAFKITEGGKYHK